MGLIHNLPHGTEFPLLNRERKGLSQEAGNTPLVEIGLFNTGALFVFRCPMCGNEEVNDQRMEPACTGPSWTDDHPLEPMILVGIKPKEASVTIPRGVESD